MRRVMVRLRASEFSAGMMAIAEWLSANHYEPKRYKYDLTEDAVMVTVDFPAAVAAEAFATHFDGVHHPSPQPASPDNSRQSPT